MSSGRKRPVSGRFRVTLDVDWLDAMVEAVKASTGATITMVNGPVLEGRVELEIRPEERAERVTPNCSDNEHIHSRTARVET